MLVQQVTRDIDDQITKYELYIITYTRYNYSDTDTLTDGQLDEKASHHNSFTFDA